MSGSAGKMGGAEMKEGLKSSLLNKVKVTDKFWRGYQELVMDTVIPYQEKILNDEIPGVEKSHALANFRIAAGLEEGEFYGMVFQDSDVAKWLEGVAYALEVRPDAELEERADKVIEIIEKAQQDDGYLNTFFTIKEPEHRWQNLQECHELYCAGHMMEAAAAYYEVTGKDRLLHVMERMAEHIGKRTRRSFFGPNVLELCQAADIVFMGLHGSNGEDGKVQATFDLLGIRYTGTGYLSSALAMDKGLTKKIFLMDEVPTPKGVSMLKENCTRDIHDLGMEFPVVVKTCCGGSSVGVYIVNDQKEYEDAIDGAYSYEDEVVVEEYIKGREFSVAVVDGKAYPIIEIAPKQGFYDYKNKYQAGSTVETCPAEISPELTEKMQRYAEAGAKALCIEGYARFDFMMKENGDMYCLEANTLPGMTPTSLIPQEAKVLGIDYPDLCEELIRISLKKYNK